MSKVPVGWEVKNLGDIATVTSGGTPSRDNIEYWNGAIPWVRTTEVKNCPLYYNDIKEFITEDGLKNSSAKLVPENSVLIAMIGQGKTRGQVAILKLPACTNQNCGIAIFDSNSDADFYFQFLLSQYEAIRKFSNSAGQSNLSGALLKKITMPVPPLPEQTKIAQILSTWDKAIATTEKLIGNSQQQKKALMQSLLTGKKRLPGFEGEWLSEELGSLGETYSGLTGKTKEDFGSGYPYISYMNVYKNIEINIDFSEKVNVGPKENQSRVSYGDIFFTTSSETPEEVGMSSVLLSHIEDTYLNSFCFGYRLFTFEKILPEFCKFVFRGDEMRRKISKLAQGATRYNLSKKRLMLLRIVLPPLPEQQKIAAVLTAADNEIDLLQKKLAFLKQEKAALMQQLLTGKRRVKVHTTEECMDA